MIRTLGIGKQLHGDLEARRMSREDQVLGRAAERRVRTAALHIDESSGTALIEQQFELRAARVPDPRLTVAARRGEDCLGYEMPHDRIAHALALGGRSGCERQIGSGHVSRDVLTKAIEV